MTQPPPLAEAFAALDAIAQPVDYCAGTLLVRQGSRVRGASLIKSGQAEATVAMPGGGQLIVAHIGGGEVIGEMALLEHSIASATVTAQSTVATAYYDRDDFRAMLAQRNYGALVLQQAVTLAMVSKLRALNAKTLAHPAPEDRLLPEDAAAPVAGGADPLARQVRNRDARFDYQRFLPLLPFFAEFDLIEIEATVEEAGLIELKRGQSIFTQGMRADAAYLVARGAAEIDVLEGRRLRRLAIAPPGSLIGYMSLIDGAPHAASAKAREDTLLLEFPRTRFEQLYRGSSGPAMKFQASIRRLLMQSLAHTNADLTRLISQARIRRHAYEELQSALYGQLCHL